MSDLLTAAPAVPLADAARILGLSRRTVERRLAAGELQGRKDGGRWLVILPAAPADSDTPSKEHDRLAGQLAELSQRYDTLSEEHDSLTKQSASERDRLTRQSQALATERDRLARSNAQLAYDCDSLSVKYASLSHEHDSATRQVAELTRRVDELERDRERWQQMAAMESANLKAALEVRALLTATTEEGRRWWQVWRRG